MIKNYKILLVFITFFLCKTIHAYSSSSFLISQTAFNNYDFTQVLYEYSYEKDLEYKGSYIDELISAVITEDIILAKKISNKILLTYPNNQEAKLISIISALNNNTPNKLQSLRYDSKKIKNELIEFLFFEGDEIKKNNDISNAFLEIVKSSYTNNKVDYPQNYNLLLFYVSLSTFINEQNFEATFIKAQLLQLIKNYFFAETTYSKIPESSEYYFDAQRNIAFNYSKENGFVDVENKIISIVENNNEDYELKKILADFYRVEKKYEIAIDLYSDLSKKERQDNWYMYYLRGI